MSRVSASTPGNLWLDEGNSSFMRSDLKRIGLSVFFCILQVYIASAKGIFQLQNVTVRLACNSLRGGECCDLMRESLGCLNATTMYLDICLMPYENIGSRTCIVHGVSPSLSVANEGSRHKLYYIKQVAIDFTLSWPVSTIPTNSTVKFLYLSTLNKMAP